MYAFVIPTLGMELLTKLLAGDTLTISRVMVGAGKVPVGTEPSTLTNLIQPIAEATSTTPIVTNGQVSFIVEYRNDLNGGLATGFYLNEFGIFAIDPNIGEVLLYYGNLGDYPEWVAAYTGGASDIRRYPISIGLTTDVEVVLNYPANAFMTSEDVTALFNTHTQKTIFSEEGVHGLRYYDGVLQGWDGTEWIDINTGNPDDPNKQSAFLGASYLAAAFLGP